MLKPGERITLITQLAQKLDELEYPELDLHLRQFGISWSNQWNGTKYNYALEMLEGAKDIALLALHEHLYGFSGAPSDDPDFWLPRMFRLFLSHVSANKVAVAELREELRRYGISGFVAHEDIQPTREWVQEIERALLTCEALLAILTPGFKESDWTDQEVGVCHGRRILIVSVRQGLDPYGFISRYQAVNGTGMTPQAVAYETYRILVQHAKASASMAEALVALFEESDSFAEAKRRVALLADVQSWTPDLLRRIEGAVAANSQIAGAWGVPSQVDQVLKQNGGAGFTRSAPPSVSPFDLEDEDLPF